MVLVRDVEAWEGHDLSLDVSAVGLDHTVQLLASAPGDVDLCTVDGECLSDHEADATAAAGDEGDAALQVEEAVTVEFAMAGCCDTLGSHAGCLGTGQ